MHLIINDDREVKKAQALVQSRYKLNPLPLKLITTLISSVQKEDTPQQEYYIRVKDFTDLADLRGKDYYDKLDKATDEILQKPIKVRLSSGKKDWLKANWCSSIRYLDGEGVIRFKISEDIFPYILDLKENYLKYDLTNILSLKSDYSIRIYEWLKDEFNKNSRYSKSTEFILEVDYIRERLEIPQSYKFQHIKDQILNKSKEDLKEHCDIKFDWEVASKLGRKVSHIKFKVSSNPKNCKDSDNLPIYLKTFMNYTNYLRDLYRGNKRFFILLKYDLGKGANNYFFGINNDNLMYAMSPSGGESIQMTKEQSEVIYNSSYLCSLHSELYRNLISEKTDFWEFSRDYDNQDTWFMAKGDIIAVLKEHNPKEKPDIQGLV